MKRLYSIILMSAIFICTAVRSYADDDVVVGPGDQSKVSIGGLNYVLRGHSAMVANTNNWEGELAIPEQVTYNGEVYTVTSLQWLAFDGCKTLTKVKIPKTVTSIEHYAFYEDCKNPFVRCTSLESIEVDDDNPSMCSVGGVLLSKDQSRLYCYPAGASRQSYSIPESVEWIGGNAFAYNSYLTSIYMPNSVTYMSFSTFSNCTRLNSIRLSENIKLISTSAFERCESLLFLDIPAGVNEFAEHVFRWSHIKTIVIRGTFSGGLRNDTFYFMDDEAVIYAQQSEIEKFKKVFSGTVLPLEEYTSDIEHISLLLPTTTVYTPNGMRQSSPRKGLNIIRTKDGQTRKVLVR